MGKQLDTNPGFEEALKAYEMRRQGKSLSHIVANTRFQDGTEAMVAIQAIERESVALARNDREGSVQMALDRLDDAIAACYEVLDSEQWKYDKDGVALEPDYKIKLDAVRTLTNVVKAQTEILGITKIDPLEGKDVVILVKGDQETYVQQLREIVEAD